MSAYKATVRIPGFKSKPNVDSKYVDDTWAMLRAAIVQIQNHTQSKLSYEELYRSCYNLVLHRHGAKLYAGLVEVTGEHMDNLRRRVEAAIDTGGFLACLNQAYSGHYKSMLTVRDILLYMDRQYINTATHESVFDLGLSQFRDKVVRTTRINNALRAALLAMVQAERNGESIDRSGLKSACTMLVQLSSGANATGDIYKEDFEGPLLTATTAFYGLESQLYLRGNDASVYLARAALRLREEESRAQQCFQGSTLQKLLRATEQQLLQNCGREVLQLPATGLAFMLTNSRVDDLRRVYELFGRIPGGHGLVCNLLQEHVRVCCSETVSGDADTKRDADAKGAGAAGEPGVPAPKDPGAKGGSSKVAVAFVQSLLDLQAKYDSLLRAAFMTERLPSRTMVPDPQFAKAVSRAMEMTLRSAARAPEYLSLFIDHRLRKDSKALSWAESTQELEKTMSATMRLFRLLQDKDVFERYYKQHFSKRLIGNKSVSDEGERSMISRLKAECGYSFTSKLERMYQDITVSHDFMAEYKKAQAAASAASQPSLDLSVRVLQTGCWPVNKVACVLPPAVAAPCRSFSDFYSNKHSGRVLTWLPTLGTAELLSLFDRSKHTLAVSTAAMLVLLQFNDAGAGKGLSYEQLENACGLPGPELQRTLQTLACGKARVLTKQPMSRRVSPGDRFRVNTAFTSKLKRVKIQTIVSRESAEERKTTIGKVDELRRYAVDAAIVRCMKARKRLRYTEVVEQVTKMLVARFVPQPSLLKKRLEDLISREFLERDPDDLKVYVYVA